MLENNEYCFVHLVSCSNLDSCGWFGLASESDEHDMGDGTSLYSCRHCGSATAERTVSIYKKDIRWFKLNE